MEIWMIFIILSVLAIVIEIFVPTLFFINFAFAGIITAIISMFIPWGLAKLFIVFSVLSLLSIICIKPILSSLLKKEDEANFNEQYIGKVVKAIENITTSSGAVTIYEERWEARLNEGTEEIPAGQDVKIVKNDSTVLYVEKI